jgi:L-rhamnose 1-dehydrogenase
VAVNHLGLPSDAHLKESLVEEARKIKAEGADAGELIEVKGDVTVPETGKLLVEETVKTWGRLDIFVSNAGVCKFAEFLE